MSTTRDLYVQGLNYTLPYIREYLGNPDRYMLVESTFLTGVIEVIRRNIFNLLPAWSSPLMGYLAHRSLHRPVSEREWQHMCRINRGRIKQITESSQGGSKSLLLWKTVIDPEGAFSSPFDVFNLQRLNQSHQIHFLDGNQEISPHTQYDTIVIQAHGTPDRLYLGPKGMYTKESTDFFQQLSRAAKPGGIISLEACSGGRGQENIAKEISKACPHSTVYAMTEDCGSRDIHYTAEGIPSFIDHTGNLTRVYRNGSL